MKHVSLPVAASQDQSATVMGVVYPALTRQLGEQHLLLLVGKVSKGPSVPVLEGL